jgi:hypothetical protein
MLTFFESHDVKVAFFTVFATAFVTGCGWLIREAWRIYREYKVSIRNDRHSCFINFRPILPALLGETMCSQNWKSKSNHRAILAITLG